MTFKLSQIKIPKSTVLKLKRLSTGDPLQCVCILTSLSTIGCKCGAMQAERAFKAKKTPSSYKRRDCIAQGILPNTGDVVVVQRPEGSSIDHGGIPLFVWARCKNKKFEVHSAYWDDRTEKKSGVAFLDVTTAMDEEQGHYFPLDGLIPT